MQYIKKSLDDIKKAIEEIEKRLDVIEKEREKLGLDRDLSADLKIAESTLPIRIVLNEQALDNNRINESLEAFNLNHSVKFDEKEGVISVYNKNNLEAVRGAILGIEHTIEVPAYTSPDPNKAMVIYQPIELFEDKQIEKNQTTIDISGVYQYGDNAPNVLNQAFSRVGLDANIELNGNTALITISQEDFALAERTLDALELKTDAVYISNGSEIGMVEATSSQIEAMYQGSLATPEEKAKNFEKNFAFDANAIAAETENGSLLDSANAQEANLGSFEGAVETAEEVEDALEACLD